MMSPRGKGIIVGIDVRRKIDALRHEVKEVVERVADGTKPQNGKFLALDYQLNKGNSTFNESQTLGFYWLLALFSSHK